MPDTGTAFRVGELLQRATQSAAVFSQLSQEHTDRIVNAVYKTALNNRVLFAKIAAEETALGNWKDKVIKNVIASQYVYEDIKYRKTVGVIYNDFSKGITKIAQPAGPVLGIISKYSPTSDAVFKILISLKTRNPIILTPDPAAVRSLNKVVELCYKAALEEDAPEDCIQCFYDTLSDEFQPLVTDNRLALIIGAGENIIDRITRKPAAPVIGSETGNIPCYISDTADICLSVKEIIHSKTFDNGVMSSAEQILIINKSVSEKVLKEFTKNKACFLNNIEKKLLFNVLLDTDKCNDIIGKTPQEIADIAGFKIGNDKKILMIRLDKTEENYLSSLKILAPVLMYCAVDDFFEAVNLCIDINYLGDRGSSISIFSNDNEEILELAKIINTGRILINTPASLGGLGGWYNTLSPSLSIACSNSSMSNVTVDDLLHIQTISKRRLNTRIKNFDFNIYNDESFDSDHIERIFNLNY